MGHKIYARPHTVLTTNKQQIIMNKQMKVTALTEKGGAIVSGWFADENKGEEYAAAMMQRGYVCVKQYREKGE